jgi:Protein of unknown function (DUF642)/PEP-CTERM motif
MLIFSSRLPRLSLAFPIAAFAALVIPTAHAQIVANGSFETGNFTGVNPGGHADVTRLTSGATNITGWTVISGVSDVAWKGNGNPFGMSASNGIRFLDLTGYQDSPPYGGVTQTLTLIQGNAYTLSFDVGSQESNFGFRGPVAVRAVVGSLDQVFTFTPMGGSVGQQWGTFTSSFTANDASTVLTFSGVTATGGFYIGLDNVSVTTSVAPEPGTLALLALGMVGGIVALRRK